MLHRIDMMNRLEHPDLLETMFKDRAIQFRDRLAWNVTVDDSGWEQDEYDTLNPVYLVLEQDKGKHGGSMRLLPTTSGSMINDHFSHLIAGKQIKCPKIWECSRFCLAPKASPRTSVDLLIGALELGLELNLECYIGVFDSQMSRLYDWLGWCPKIIGKGSVGGRTAYVGLWYVSEKQKESLITKFGALPARTFVHQIAAP